MVSLAVLAVGTFTTFLLEIPPEQRMWVGLRWLFAVFFHGGVALTNIFHQRCAAHF
jgi:hypothetical protein